MSIKPGTSINLVYDSDTLRCALKYNNWLYSHKQKGLGTRTSNLHFLSVVVKRVIIQFGELIPKEISV